MSVSRVDAVEALSAATQAISRPLALEPVLQVIVDQVRGLVAAEYAALGIVGSDGAIERFITSGIDPRTRAAIGPLPRGHGLLGLIIREGEPVRIRDIGADHRRVGFPPAHPAMHSFLGAPIRVEGRSVGNLYLTNKQDAPEFSDDDERLVSLFALHAGIAIENARLHEQVQALAVVDERERISKDLHDGIIQSLYGVGLSLEDVPEIMRHDLDEAEQRVEAAIDSIHLTIRDIRNFIFGLQPELLEGASLRHGLATIVEEIRRHTIADIELNVVPEVGEPPAKTASALLAIAGEALSNMARHSRATRARVEVYALADALQLVVADNGSGMEMARGAAVGHQGMRNMRDRAQRLGGSFDVESSPSTGTRVTATVPVEGQAA
jgi:signal transduction histidine kinase